MKITSRNEDISYKVFWCSRVWLRFIFPTFSFHKLSINAWWLHIRMYLPQFVQIGHLPFTFPTSNGGLSGSLSSLTCTSRPAAYSATPALIALSTATLAMPSAHAPAAMMAKPATRQTTAKAQLTLHIQDAAPIIPAVILFPCFRFGVRRKISLGDRCLEVELELKADWKLEHSRTFKDCGQPLFLVDPVSLIKTPDLSLSQQIRRNFVLLIVHRYIISTFLLLHSGHPRPTAGLRNLQAAPPRVRNIAPQPIVPLRPSEGRRDPREGQRRRPRGGRRLCRASLPLGGRRGEGALLRDRERGCLGQGWLLDLWILVILDDDRKKGKRWGLIVAWSYVTALF